MLRVNADPGFAAGFSSASAADRRAAADVVLHYLFRGLGWSAEYHTKFMTSVGTDVVTCPNGCDVDNSANSGVAWSARDMRVIKTPALVKAIEEQFGVVVFDLTLAERLTESLSQDEGGVRIAAIAPGSPLAEAGLAVGDIIQEVDTARIFDSANLFEALRAAQADGLEIVRIAYIRDGEAAIAEANIGLLAPR